MTKILILTKRSFLIIFLFSNTISLLSAAPYPYDRFSYNRQTITDLHVDIKEKLISKGLQDDIAVKKIDKLFTCNKNAAYKLSRLSADSTLMLSKEKMVETLATYALFENSLNLSSYESVIGFVQRINPDLNKAQLSAIKRIASI